MRLGEGIGSRIAFVSKPGTKWTYAAALISGFSFARNTQTDEVQRSFRCEYRASAPAQSAQCAALVSLRFCGRQQARGAAEPLVFPPMCCIAQPDGQRCPSRHCQEAHDGNIMRRKATLRSQATPL